MDNLEMKWIRKYFNTINGMLFLYKICFDLVATFVMLLMYPFFSQSETFFEGGIWYLVASTCCFIIFLLWKRPYFFRTCIFPVRRSMSIGKFFCFFGVFMLMQTLSSYLYILMEIFANLFGVSLFQSLEIATGNSITFSMFLYSALFTPVVEEFIFRGAILKSLEPFGKWFALLTSSLLFGLMHSNFAQIPFAIGAGLILGYIAMEYSIWHSIGLHIMNNFVLGDLLPKFLRLLPDTLANLLNLIITNGLIAIGFIFLITHLQSIRNFCSTEHSTLKLLRIYFTTVLGILFILYSIWGAWNQLIFLS